MMSAAPGAPPWAESEEQVHHPDERPHRLGEATGGAGRLPPTISCRVLLECCAGTSVPSRRVRRHSWPESPGPGYGWYRGIGYGRRSALTAAAGAAPRGAIRTSAGQAAEDDRSNFGVETVCAVSDRECPRSASGRRHCPPGRAHGGHDTPMWRAGADVSRAIDGTKPPARQHLLRLCVVGRGGDEPPTFHLSERAFVQVSDVRDVDVQPVCNIWERGREGAATRRHWLHLRLEVAQVA